MNTISLSICSKSIRTVDGLYCLNDLHKAAGNFNKHRPSLFMANSQTQDLIKEVEQSSNSCLALKTVRGGSSQGTYVCYELVVAYAAWISPKFHLTVIRAFMAMNEQAKIEQPKQQALSLLPIPFQQGRYLIEVNEDGTKIIDATNYELIRIDAFQKMQQECDALTKQIYHHFVHALTEVAMNTSDEYRHGRMPVLGEFVKK